jgi:hypothetical protein
MTASATLNEYLASEAKTLEDIKTITAATDVIKQEFVSCYPKEVENVEEVEKNYKTVFKMTTMSIKMHSTSYYKDRACLDAKDIDQIKTALENFKNNNEKVINFKNELINDLSFFQEQIRNSHVQRLAALIKEKKLLAKELNVLNFQKHKLIMDRLSKILWPYDENTKEYDAKITATEMKIGQYTQKIERMQTSRPMANEKDILIYQMHLKEKYGNK